MTDEQLQQIKARTATATPGPWRSYTPEETDALPPEEHFFHSHDAIIMPLQGDLVREGHKHYVGATMNCHLKNYINDSIFIANAREDIPVLIEEVEFLRSQIKFMMKDRNEQ